MPVGGRRGCLTAWFSPTRSASHSWLSARETGGIGSLDLDEPVQRYWPEFELRPPCATSCRTKPVWWHSTRRCRPRPSTTYYLCRLLAAQEPAWEPGTAHGESALFYGHLVGELVRRVDGRTVGRFLREEICGPLGIDFSFGLDAAQQARTVELTGLDSSFLTANVSGRPPLYLRAIGNPPGAQDGAVVNSPAWRAAEIPAVNGHGTGRAVAGFYHALSSGRILSADTLAEATRPQCSGTDQVFGDDNTWGLDSESMTTGSGWAAWAGATADEHSRELLPRLRDGQRGHLPGRHESREQP